MSGASIRAIPIGTTCPKPIFEAIALPSVNVAEAMPTAVLDRARAILACVARAARLTLTMPFIFATLHTRPKAAAGRVEHGALLSLTGTPPVVGST